MTQSKKPTGAEWEHFVDLWYNLDHDGKVALASKKEVTYDTAKHWVSNSGSTRKQVEQKIFTFAPQTPRVNVPLKLQTTAPMTTVAILGDTHNPYQDNEVVFAVETFLTELQPDYLIYNGDINDFYQVSVFAKDPSRLGQLQSDIDITTAMFRRHNNSLPNTKKILIEGTHENRWFKYLQNAAPALANLNATNINELYQLKTFDIDFVPFERGVLINGVFLVLHGDIASAHSSYTAKRHYEKHGGNGMCNHTHRGGSYYKRDRFGIWGWWENFCLCQLNPDWIQNPDWTHGFSLVHFNNQNRFWVEQIPIINGNFIYNGILWGD